MVSFNTKKVIKLHLLVMIINHLKVNIIVIFVREKDRQESCPVRDLIPIAVSSSGRAHTEHPSPVEANEFVICAFMWLTNTSTS